MRRGELGWLRKVELGRLRKVEVEDGTGSLDCLERWRWMMGRGVRIDEIGDVEERDEMGRE